MNYLIFKVKDYLLGVRKNSVSKIVQSMLKIDDNLHSWFSGYIFIDGKKVYIIDILFQLGLSMSTYPSGHIYSFILFNSEQSNYGIMVDEIIGEVSASSLNSSRLKTIYGTCNSKLIAGSLYFGDKNVPILDEGFLVPSFSLINNVPTKFFPSYTAKIEEKVFLNSRHYGK